MLNIENITDDQLKTEIQVWIKTYICAPNNAINSFVESDAGIFPAINFI